MKRILILFPDEWLAYSPSILNLIACINARDDVSVEVVCLDNGRYPLDRNAVAGTVHAIKTSRRVVGMLGMMRLAAKFKARLLRRKARELAFDEVIGVDLVGLEAALAVSRDAHLFSLELAGDSLRDSPLRARIASVAIQSKERYAYLFGDLDMRVFFIQNAPEFRELPAAPERPGRGTRLVCFGNLIPRHGVYQCIESLAELDDATLTLAGRLPHEVRKTIERRYAKLLEAGRLLLEPGYVRHDGVCEFLSRFDIGLCFYDFSLIAAGDFNYLSSPSGKIFNYMAAGLPVIGNDIAGFQPVAEHGAGILLDGISPARIAEAVTRIRDRYEAYRERALKAGKVYSFPQAARPYIEYLARRRS